MYDEKLKPCILFSQFWLIWPFHLSFYHRVLQPIVVVNGSDAKNLTIGNASDKNIAAIPAFLAMTPPADFLNFGKSRAPRMNPLAFLRDPWDCSGGRQAAERWSCTR